MNTNVYYWMLMAILVFFDLVCLKRLTIDFIRVKIGVGHELKKVGIFYYKTKHKNPRNVYDLIPLISTPEKAKRIEEAISEVEEKKYIFKMKVSLHLVPFLRWYPREIIVKKRTEQN